MSDVEDRISQLRGETEQTLYEFLKTDLEISFTFADVANTELKIGDRNGAVAALERGEKGYVTIRRFLATLEPEKYRDPIVGKLDELRNKLDTIRELLRKSSVDADVSAL